MAQAEVDLSVGGLLASIKGVLVRNQKLLTKLVQRSFPVSADFAGSALYPATGVLVVDLGGPAQGQVWLIRRWMFLSAGDPTSSPAGVGFIFTGTSMSSAVSPVLSATLANMQLVDKTNAPFPTSGFYDAGMVVCRYPEHIIGVVTAGTIGAGYMVNGTATQVPEGSDFAEVDF